MADSPPTNANRWHANHLEFMQWLATPKSERQFKTQKTFAAHLGVDPATLSDWKRLDGFMDEVAVLARQSVKNELVDIYRALIDKAKQGDVPAIKLALEVTHEYSPRTELTGAGGGAIIVKGYVNVSPDDWTD